MATPKWFVKSASPSTSSVRKKMKLTCSSSGWSKPFTMTTYLQKNNKLTKNVAGSKKTENFVAKGTEVKVTKKASYTMYTTETFSTKAKAQAYIKSIKSKDSRCKSQDIKKTKDGKYKAVVTLKQVWYYVTYKGKSKWVPYQVYGGSIRLKDLASPVTDDGRDPTNIVGTQTALNSSPAIGGVLDGAEIQNPKDAATVDVSRKMRAHSIDKFLRNTNEVANYKYTEYGNIGPDGSIIDTSKTYKITGSDSVFGERDDDFISEEIGTSTTSKAKDFTSSTNTNKKTTQSKMFNHALRARTIIYEDRNKWDYAYNRMKHINPYNAIGNTTEYLFFTKPDLHLMGKSTPTSFTKVTTLNPQLDDPFWREMHRKYGRLMHDLQYSSQRTGTANDGYNHDKSEFIRILTNAASSTLDLPGVSADTVDTPQTIYGTSIQYKKSSLKSDESYDFSLEFQDNPQLEVYHLFKMWDTYSTLKDLGKVTPPGKDNNNPYRTNKILHDQIGIFKFVVAEDMETIVYYAYLTGAFPKSVPREAMGNINPGMISYSVDWHAQFVDDMNPAILVHFNMLMRKQARGALAQFTGGLKGHYSGNPNDPKGILSDDWLKEQGYKFVPILSDTYHEINGGFRDICFVKEIKDNSVPGTKSRYLLHWYDKEK